MSEKNDITLVKKMFPSIFIFICCLLGGFFMLFHNNKTEVVDNKEFAELIMLLPWVFFGFAFLAWLLGLFIFIDCKKNNS